VNLYLIYNAMYTLLLWSASIALDNYVILIMINLLVLKMVLQKWHHQVLHQLWLQIQRQRQVWMVLVLVTAIKSDSKCIQLEMLTLFSAQNFSCYPDVLSNQIWLHHLDVSRVVQAYWQSDQLPDTMVMHMGCVLLPIIIVVECQYSPVQLCDSDNNYSVDITGLDNSLLKH